MYCTKWIGRPCDETYVGKEVGRLYVCIDCTCARKRAVYCSLQLAGQGEKKKRMVRIKAF